MKQTSEKPALYIVATPIGNLEDMTHRAIRILKDEVDYIASEDTRMTRILCNHYSITTPLISYHAQSSQGKEDAIITHLENGLSVALVSDAGTPTISDPGVKLVQAAKKISNVRIVPIPGPSALITAYSASGIAGNEFVFLGFLPHKKGRETLFNEIAQSKRTMIFYESPHRIMKTLESLIQHCDDKRNIVVARELTKIYESFISGSPQEVFDIFTANPETIRGEFVVMVEGV